MTSSVAFYTFGSSLVTYFSFIVPDVISGFCLGLPDEDLSAGPFDLASSATSAGFGLLSFRAGGFGADSDFLSCCSSYFLRGGPFFSYGPNFFSSFVDGCD